MEKYIEPTLKTRQLFFLSIALLGGLALLASHRDKFLPPLNHDPSLAIDQMLNRSLVAALISTILFISFSVAAIHYTRLVIRSGQWPPKGMNVPFRTKIRKIKNPWNARTYLIVIMCLFAAQTVMPWAIYAQQRTLLGELKQQIYADETTPPPPPPTPAATP